MSVVAPVTEVHVCAMVATYAWDDKSNYHFSYRLRPIDIKDYEPRNLQCRFSGARTCLSH